jgi:hypothetical protein
MFLLTTPFVHSNIRSASYGQRIFIGILTGVALFLFNQTFTETTIPWISAKPNPWAMGPPHTRGSTWIQTKRKTPKIKSGATAGHY